MRWPKIWIMGEEGMEEVPHDELPSHDAIELQDHFKRVKLSPRAIDMASKMIPLEFYFKEGLHTFLRGRAELVFSKLSASQTEGVYGKLKYVFEFDADGPVLKTVSLV